MSPDSKLHVLTGVDVPDKNYVLYRLPHAERCVLMHQSTGSPLELASYAALDGISGFVFAPFKVGAGVPVLLLQPDIIETYALPCISPNSCGNAQVHSAAQAERAAYHSVFASFHSRLCAGDFDKIVLSRRSEEHLPAGESPLQLFLRACSHYPRMFIALVSIPRAGLWLMATPEILLERVGTEWHTMALAGTMRLTEGQLCFDTPACTMPQDAICWSDKNVREQRYVASYIRERLSAYAGVIRESRPYTARAGYLVHLRSDFMFTLHDGNDIGRIIESLHPTPAVCGIPRSSAYDFICQNEGFDRGYYSGFAGVKDVSGATHLYVTLRCMQIEDTKCTLYAGGGLLRDSAEEAEWAETEAKMDTMRRCFATKRI